jgi:hypothetical protein
MVSSVLSPANAAFSRAERLIKAAEDACARFESVSLSQAESFGAIGEILTWLCALDELPKRSAPRSYEAEREADRDGLLVPGLRCARNATIHRLSVTTVTYVHPGAVLGAAQLGTFALGEGPNSRWAARNSDWGNTRRRKQSLEDPDSTYDTHFAGRGVVPCLRRSLNFLHAASGIWCRDP